jgi:hypothetical protein
LDRTAFSPFDIAITEYSYKIYLMRHPCRISTIRKAAALCSMVENKSRKRKEREKLWG